MNLYNYLTVLTFSFSPMIVLMRNANIIEIVSNIYYKLSLLSRLMFSTVLNKLSHIPGKLMLIYPMK